MFGWLSADAALASERIAARLGIARVCGGQKLEGDKVVQTRVAGFPDDAHSALTQLFDDTVVGDGLAHEEPELGSLRFA